MQSQISLITKKGTWSCTRHPDNDRGDASSKLRRQQSVENIGIVFSIRGVFVVENEVGRKPLILCSEDRF